VDERAVPAVGRPGGQSELAFVFAFGLVFAFRLGFGFALRFGHRLLR
jgi:hypothetical protein